MNRLEAVGAERVFEEPWQAQAFALAVHLHRARMFTWSEWARALSVQIAAAGPDDGAGYYRSWLAALESLVIAKGVAKSDELVTRKGEWDHAYRTTPHGQPVAI